MKSKLLLCACLTLAPLAGVSARSRPSLGYTYVCNFPNAGRVVIDTREPGSSVTVHGRKYLAQGGSYFYSVNDGEMNIYFKSGGRRWAFGEDGPLVPCSSHRNRR